MKIKSFFLILFLCVFSISWGQGFEKTHEFGGFIAPGLFTVKQPNFMATSQFNSTISAGVTYSRRFHRSFTYRMQLGVGFDFSTSKFAPGAQIEKTKYRTLITDFSPFQMHYTVNPDNGFQFYMGLGVGIRTRIRTTATTYYANGTDGQSFINKKYWEVAPTFLMGIKIVSNEYGYFYIQPEYRIVPRSYQSSLVRHGFNLQVGLSYKFGVKTQKEERDY